MGLKEVYSGILALLPILSMYRGIGSKLDLGTVIIGVLFTLTVLSNIRERKCRIEILWCVYIMYILLSILIPVLSDNFANKDSYILLRLIKHVTYILIFLISYGSQLYDIYILIKVYKIISVIASLFLVFQVFCAKYLGKLVVGYISGLVNHGSYVEDISRTTVERFRPSSFFYEPGQYFSYVFIAIVLYLFSNSVAENKNILLALIISGGVILSTSGAGILFVALAWGTWFCWQIFLGNKRGHISVFFILFCMMIICIMPLMLKSSRFIYALNRVFNLEAEGGNAVIGRMYGFTDILNMPLLNFLFGYGYANVGTDYYPTFASIILYTGLIGLLLIILLFYNIYKKQSRREMRIAFIGYLILCFYSEMFISVNLLFFMVLLNSPKRNCAMVKRRKIEI